MASALRHEAEAETALAKEAFKRKDYQAAAYGFGRALEIHERAGGEPPEGLHLLHSNHSAALAALGFHEASLSAARQSIALGGTSFVKGQYRAALALVALEQWDEAQEACQAALAVTPESAQLLAMLQKCQQATARRTEAEMLRVALQDGPHADTNNDVAIGHHNAGRGVGGALRQGGGVAPLLCHDQSVRENLTTCPFGQVVPIPMGWKRRV